jgi:hypothetical protein
MATLCTLWGRGQGGGGFSSGAIREDVLCLLYDRGIILCFRVLGRDRPPGTAIAGRIVHEAEIAATDDGKWMTAAAAEGANTATESRGGGKRSGDAVAVATGDDPEIADGEEGIDPESGTVPGWWITEEFKEKIYLFGLNLSVPRIICFQRSSYRDRYCFLNALC